jgi:dCMP deaminase
MKQLTINPDRIELDEAYLQMAEVWATRSKANRLQVGAILVKNKRIISDGYNGMPAGCEGEDEVCEEYADDPNYDGRDSIGEPPDKIVKTKSEVLHAEANCILKLAASDVGGGSEGSTLYVTHSPCPDCSKLIIQAKIKRVVFRKHYRLSEGIKNLEKRGIKCVQLTKED